MVEVDILRRRVDGLLEHLDRLQAFAAIDRDDFMADGDTHHLAERHLHLAIECAIDIAHHLIADAGFPAPETYRDGFAILGRHGVLKPDLAERLQQWAGLRNVLVHVYLEIDHGLTWDAIHKDLGDLRELATVAAKLL